MYTIKEASARSGVGVPLLRAWERRYAVVAPARTAGGYRLYDDTAIARLRAMRQLIADGWSAQQAAEHVRRTTDRDLDSIVGASSRADEAAEPPVAGDADGTAQSLVNRIVHATRTLDGPSLESALDEAFAAGRFETVADRIVMPALRAIGDAWAGEEVSVAGEHAASNAILRRLAMAFEAAGDADDERPILVGLGPGGRHELGALAFATATRRAGLPVLYLGADLPPDSWTSAATSRQARAAVIGVPTRADVPRARAVLAAMRDVPARPVMAVGGQEAGRLATEPGVVVIAGDLAESVAALRAALG
jgi:MerR family transcriptional regulator, light-induced transcriptional regulator